MLLCNNILTVGHLKIVTKEGRKELTNYLLLQREVVRIT